MGEEEKINNVRKTARRVGSLGKLPKSFVSVDDVIATNDINEILSEVHQKRSDIKSLLVIWANPDGRLSYRYVKCDDYRVISMCEIIKQHCIHEAWL